MTDKSVSDSDEEGSIRATAISTGSSFSGSSQGNPQGNSQGNTPGSIKRSGLKGLLKSLFSRNGDSQLRETFEEILEEIDEQEGIDNSFGEGARTILANIVKAGDATAEDVMVPRADIASIDDSTPLLDAISIMVEMPHSRYPIYHETPDNVIGMVHIKDVLRAFKERSETGALPVSQDKNFALESIRREVMFVAPSIRILDLLLEMRESRRHMALIVDEYGGIDGLITIEDLVEEIVGDIVDEHDEDKHPQLTLMADGSYRVEARYEIEDFEETVGPFLTDEERDEDIDTMGGLIFHLIGRVPTRGELVTHDPSGLEFEITEADPRRIKRMRIRGTENLNRSGEV